MNTPIYIYIYIFIYSLSLQVIPPATLGKPLQSRWRRRLGTTRSQIASSPPQLHTRHIIIHTSYLCVYIYNVYIVIIIYLNKRIHTHARASEIIPAIKWFNERPSGCIRVCAEHAYRVYSYLSRRRNILLYYYLRWLPFSTHRAAAWCLCTGPNR